MHIMHNSLLGTRSAKGSCFQSGILGCIKISDPYETSLCKVQIADQVASRRPTSASIPASTIRDSTLPLCRTNLMNTVEQVMMWRLALSHRFCAGNSSLQLLVQGWKCPAVAGKIIFAESVCFGQGQGKVASWLEETVCKPNLLFFPVHQVALERKEEGRV